MRTFLTLLGAATATAMCSGENQITVEESTTEMIEVRSTTRSSGCKDTLKIRLKLNQDDGIEARLDYFGKKRSDDDGEEEEDDDDDVSKFHFRQKAFQAIEFNDTNGNNVIDEGEIVQIIRLGSDEAPWQPLGVSTTDEAGVTVYTVTASAGSPSIFQAVARYAGGTVSFVEGKNTYSLDPRSLKIDYIVNWPWSADAGENTKLAIDGRFKTFNRFKGAYGDRDDEDESEDSLDKDDDDEVSTDAPATDAPATDAPATDAPTTDAPTTDAPSTTTAPVRRLQDDAEEADESSEEDEEEIDAGDDRVGIAASFAWTTTVQTDTDLDVPVVASSKALISGEDRDALEEGEHNRRIVWVFDTSALNVTDRMPATFTWDPKLSANAIFSANTAASVGVSVFSALALAAAIFA